MVAAFLRSQRSALNQSPGLFVDSLYFVRPEGVCHQWRKEPPGELSIDPVADERLGRVTGRAEAS